MRSMPGAAPLFRFLRERYQIEAQLYDGISSISLRPAVTRRFHCDVPRIA